MTPLATEEHDCCLNMGAHIPAPDISAAGLSIPVPGIIHELDGLLAQNDLANARLLLEDSLRAARGCGDWRGELSMLSELMGLHRRTGDRMAARRAVQSGLAIVDGRGLVRTVSGATVMLNAATTMKAFGLASESLRLFDRACRVYSEMLDPSDYRFAGLYNNMALSYADVGDYMSAEGCFMRAIAVMKTCPTPENELAVTCCNLAELYERVDPEDARIGECMEKAWEYLDCPNLARDGYYAFNAGKCASAFGRFGYFIYEAELKKRAGEIYAGT